MKYLSISLLFTFILSIEIYAQYPGAPDFGNEISSFNAGLLTPTPDRSLFGVEHAEGYLWVNGFDPDDLWQHKLYKFAEDGSELIDVYNQGVGYNPWKGLVYDGNYLYMGSKDSLVEVSTQTGFPTGNRIPAPINPVESVTYDPESDHFWVYGYFDNNIYEIDRDGEVYRVIANPLDENESTLGIAWDNVNPGGPFIWTWNTINAYDSVYTEARQIHVESGNFTGTKFVGNVKSPTYQFDYAGGATISDELAGDTLVFVAVQLGHYEINDQMDWIVNYNLDLTDAPLPGPYISVNPDEISNTLEAGDSTIVELDISNTGLSNLNWSAVIEGLIPPPGGNPNNPGDTLLTFNASALTPDNDYLLRTLEFARGKYWIGGRGFNGSQFNKLYSISKDGQALISVSNQPALYNFGWSAMFSDDNFLYGNDQYFIREYDMDLLMPTGDFIPRLGFSGTSMAYDPQKDQIWLGSSNGAVKIIDRDGEEVNFFVTDYAITAMAWDRYTPGGPYLWIWSEEQASTGASAVAIRLDTETLQETGVSFPAVNLSGNSTYPDEVLAATITRDIFTNQLSMAVLHESTDPSNRDDHVVVYDLDVITPPEWIKLLGATHGTVPVDSTGILWVKLLAVMEDTIMTAGVKISSNDITYPEIIIPVTFDMKPLFTSMDDFTEEPEKTHYVFPNPANENASLRIFAKEAFEVMTTDSQGKLIQRTRHVSQDGWMTVPLQTSDMQDGLYFYRIIMHDEIRYGKFILQ